MAQPDSDQDARNPHEVEPDLVDMGHTRGDDPAAEGTLDVGGRTGGPEVPERAEPAEAVGGLGAGSASEKPESEGFPGGPATGSGANAELEEKDVPDETPAEMPPGRKYGTPGITDGT